jgi:chromosome segregation ATPase
MLKVLQSLLEANKISQEVAKIIDDDLSNELSKLRDEAASWRVKFKELNETYESVSKTKDTLEDQLKDIDSKIEKAKSDGKKEVLTELEKEKEEKNNLMQELRKLETSRNELRIENAINKELSSYDVIDKDIIFDTLKLKVELKDDKLLFKDGKELQEGIKTFFENKPHLLKAKGNSGSGSQNSNSDFGKDTLTAKILSARR